MRSQPPALVNTPVLDALRAGARPSDLPGPWPQIGEPTADGVPVTFAAVAPAGSEVLVHLNGITDRFRTDFEWALLPVVHALGAGDADGTGESDGTAEAAEASHAVHAAAFLLPERLICGYRLVTMDHVPRNAGADRPGWLAIHEAGRTDPLCPAVLPTVLGAEASVLSLPGAVEHSAWEPGAPALRAAPAVSELGGGVRLLDSGREDAAVVLFDAEQWLALGLVEALRRLPRPAPLILAVDSGTLRERGEFLPYPERVEAVVLPALEGVRRNRPWLGRERILATGQSYGGLAAVGLCTVGEAPAGAALAQSASLHFVPGHGRPSGDGETGELIRRISGRVADVASVIELVSGTEEHGMYEVAESAVPVLRAAGHRVSLRGVAGGHDYAWWRHELLAALERW